MISSEKSKQHIYDTLDQLFDTLFSTCNKILGDILSIGIRFGGNLDLADHMLVVFPDKVYGFQFWNEVKGKQVWYYDKNKKGLYKNDKECDQDDEYEFLSFIIDCMNAVDKKEVEFSKDIKQEDLDVYLVNQ